MARPEDAGSFAVTMPLCKVWEDEDGEMRFEGVASSTTLDRQQERMTPRAIQKMALHTGLELLPSHSAGPLEELGVIEEAWADNSQFRVAGRLDPSNPAARRLFEKAASGRQFGLSVGGRVTKAFWRYDEDAGRQVRHIDDVELDHVAVCRPGAAANPDTYLAALAKAAEGVIGEQPEDVDEEAMLVRIGRAAVHAARSLWPFAKAEDGVGDEADGDDVDEELAELKALRKDLESALGEVREALETLAKGEPEEDEDEVETRAHGASQALPGQDRRDGGGLWRGVV